jgi:SecD/SecF fusion protein
VELPGANDPDRVRKLLKQTAKLEFYETYTINEIESFLTDADKAVYAYEQSHKNKDSLAKKGIDTANKKNDNPLAYAENKSDTSKSANPLAANTNDSTGKKGAKGKTAENRVTPLLSALNQSQQMANSPVIGAVRISDTASVNRMLNLQVVKDALPPEAKLVWANKAPDNSDMLELYALRTTGLVDKEAVLYGDVITDAREDVDRNTNSYEVTMQMSPEGASEWGNITRRNIGKFVAIVLDNQVYSCPRVNQEIDGGNSQITGSFKAAEASDLANVLKSGKLPVELDVVDEAVVGPSMGQQAINSGLSSLLIGLLAITAFMVIYYNRSGWVANLALLINLFFIIGVLASLGASLTMPGMAGIVLTLAMAVDANVLIYERIREELDHDKSIKMAISDGYRHAMSSIIDGNITTLLIGICRPHSQGYVK